MNALAAYSREALGADVNVTQCPDTPLPAYLSHFFDFGCGEVLGVACVFATPRPDVPRAPAALAKRLEHVAQAFERPAALVLDPLPARDRRRLVAKRVPFIVPFVYAYLPHVLIDSRETARPGGTTKRPAPEVFAPTTQLMLLHGLLGKTRGDLYAEELTEALGVSNMSISRALRELEAAGLITRPDEGCPRPAHLARSRRETWQQAQPLLRSPVRARHLVSEPELPGALEVGLTALSCVTDLAPPLERTIALSQEAWRELRDEHDERIEFALEQVMGSLLW